VTSYKCTPNRKNASEWGITLPGHSKVSLAAPTLWQLQLF
jgi:hypothetical protein